MAQKSKIVRNEQRARTVAALAARPRDASATRPRDRDCVDGRPRGCLRGFGLPRIRLRELARRGELPGVTGSSR
ncbi:30S ribosomal protein S14 [Thermobifida halotolerans]|uniref:30S ribosomal protein S14 n=1 Tax=Thermobifida halotolerans TaxID=483545 RepID=A0A399G8C7_9ACTN|nr:uS14 family ribosomal protein [Thermobifida halotolerans]UOE21106.1 30S ribosomal protein S14 [Thermobifida halotolerans]